MSAEFFKLRSKTGWWVHAADEEGPAPTDTGTTWFWRISYRQGEEEARVYRPDEAARVAVIFAAMGQPVTLAPATFDEWIGNR